MTDINVDIEEENIDLDISNDSAISLDIEDSTPIEIDLVEENIDIDITSDSDINIDIEGNAPSPTNFIDLTDTPNSYSGHGEKLIQVNSAENALEFIDSVGGEWGEITGTLSDQTDLQSALDLKVSEAPIDTKQYARQDGDWSEVVIPDGSKWEDDGTGYIKPKEDNLVKAEYIDGIVTADEKVKYDSLDPTAGYVSDKIIAGSGIGVAEGTGTDENKLVITNTDKGSDVDLSSYATEQWVEDKSYLTSFTETDPVFNAWDKSTGISITESQISDLQTYYLASNPSGFISDLTSFTTDNLNEGITNKYDETVVLNQGDNVTITGTYPEFTIASQDTTYTTSDFDIKDIADSTNLRTTWSGKQDELVSGTNIKTINTESLLGSSDISLQTPLTSGTDYEVPLTFTTGLTRIGDSVSCDITQYEDSDAVSAIKADADWKASDWNTAYSWGDHADAGYQLTSEKGQNNGYASLDAGGKVPSAQLPASVMHYLGTWNATTNTPTLADGVGTSGDVYIVSVAGTQDLGSGSITFEIGDWVLYNGSIWEKSINSNAVVSVNGQTGVVSLDTDDISEGTNKYDKTVTFAGGTNVIIGGTYPDFTLTDNSITSSDVQTYEVDPLSLHLDQTSPQTFIAGDVSGSGLLKVTSGELGLDSNTYITEESDPVFSISPAVSITTSDITHLGNLSGTNTGDQDLSGYVPYTGATGNVDLGANSLKTSGTIYVNDTATPFPEELQLKRTSTKAYIVYNGRASQDYWEYTKATKDIKYVGTYDDIEERFPDFSLNDVNVKINKTLDVTGTVTGSNLSGTNTGDQESSDFDHNSLTNTHNLTSDISHNSISNTHNLTTDIDHNSITNTHDLTSDINHNTIFNTHNLTSDIDHNELTNYESNEHIDWTTSQTPVVIHADNYLDEKVKYDEFDGTSGYLSQKVIAGSGILISEGTGVSENKLVITNDDKGSDVDLSAYLTSVAYTDLTGSPSDVITAGQLISWDGDTLNVDNDLSNYSNVTSAFLTSITSESIGDLSDVTLTAGKTLTITDNTTLSGGTHSGNNTGDQDLSGYYTTSEVQTNYVPYTGATANVDLGTNDLTGASIAGTSLGITGEYNFPGFVGTAGQVLRINPVGVMSWSNALTEVNDGGMADDFHRHSALAASDGIPTNVISIDDVGEVTVTHQIVSTLADGTAPYQCTSTTLNTNLNADMVDGVHVSGSNTGDQTSIVGITGTTAQFNTALTDGSFAISGGAFHDGFSDFVANEHIDWTADSAGTIHSTNYTDTKPPTASITMFGGSSAPDGWLICDGSAVSRETYSDLFSAISTTYGAGDGSTTFAIPDLRTRVAVGKNASGTFENLGATGGAETHQLSEAELATHTHTQDSHNHTQDAHNHTQNAHNHTQDAHTHTQNAHKHINGAMLNGYSYPYNYASLGTNYSGLNTDTTHQYCGYTSDTTPTNQNTTATNQNTTATNNNTTATNQATTATNQNTGSNTAHNNLQPYIVLNYIIKT